MAVNYKVEVDVDDAEKKLKQISSKFEDAFNAGRSFDGNNLALKKMISETSTYLRQLKKEYQDTVSTLESKGVDTENNKYLIRLKDDIKAVQAELDGLRENWRERRMSSENMFQGIAEGAQGLMGAFTAAQGAAAMFGAEEEKLQKIQTKLQASMSMLMGLQRLGNALQSTSQFRVQILNKLMEKYHQMNLKVAKSEGIKKLAMAGWAGLIAGAIAGLTALIIKYSKYADEVQRVKELQEAFKGEFSASATSQLSSLAQLQSKWKNISGDIERQQLFIRKYKDELNDLGIEASNVKSVEQGLVDNSDAVVRSIMAKARAAAYLAKVNALAAEAVNLQAENEVLTDKERSKWGYWFNPRGMIEAAKRGKLFYSYDEYNDMLNQRNTNKNNEKLKKILGDNLDGKGGLLAKALQDYQDELFKSSLDDLKNDSDLAKELAERARAVENANRAYLDTIARNEREERRTRENLRNQIEDAELAVMEDGYEKRKLAREKANRRELADLKKQKEDYIEAAKSRAKAEFDAAEAVIKAKDKDYIPEVFDPDSVSVDTSIFDDLIAATQSRQYADNLQRVLDENSDFVREFNKIWDEFNGKQEDLFLASIDLSPEEYDRALNKLLTVTQDRLADFASNLASSFEDADFSEWAKKMQSMGLQDLQIELSTLELQLESLGNAETMSEEETVKLQAAIALLKRTIRDFDEDVLQQSSKSFRDWSAAIELTRETFNDISSSIGGTVGEIAKSIGSVLTQIQSVRNSMSVLGDGTASDADRLSAKMNIASSAISGIIQMVGQYVNALEEAKQAEEEWMRTMRQSEHELAMLRLAALDYRKDNIFGVENPYSKAIAGAEQYAAAIGELNKMQEQWNEGQVQVDTERKSTWKRVLGGIASGAGTGAAIGTIAGGWAAGIGTAIGAAIGAVVGGIVGIASEKAIPVFESLSEHYGQLYDENYELNQQLIADYDKLDDTTKQIVDNWDEIVNKMKEAEEQMRENFHDLAGDLGDRLSDALVSAFRSGKIDSAIGTFKGDVTKAIESIVQQSIFSSLFQDLFSGLEQDMMKSFGAGGDQNLIDDIMRFDSAYQDRIDAYSKAMQEAQDYYKRQGYDLWGAENTRTAASKAISGVSQESFDDALGRFTAIQSHTYELNETTKTLREQQGNLLAVTSQILFEVQGIHRDTERMQVSLDTIQGDMTHVRSGVSQMTDKGVRMLN